MENFIFSINATMPIFLVILIGWVIKKIGIINDEFANVANRYVFKIALPVLLFRDIATTSILDDMDWRFVAFCFFGTMAMFGLVWVVGYICLADKTSVGAFGQVSARGSAAVLGIAFVEQVCGDSGMAPLMIVAAVPLFNILTVVMLTFSGKNQAHGKNGIKKAFINILKNPIIIGIILGVPFSVFNISIPTIPTSTINYVAQTATPVALIAVGASFDVKTAMGKIRPAILATFLKLIVLPCIFIPAGIALGFGSSELMAILIMTGAPTTATAYTMAKSMDNDEVLTSNAIVLTTLVASITLTAWVYILKASGHI